MGCGVLLARVWTPPKVNWQCWLLTMFLLWNAMGQSAPTCHIQNELKNIGNHWEMAEILSKHYFVHISAISQWFSMFLSLFWTRRVGVGWPMAFHSSSWCLAANTLLSPSTPCPCCQYVAPAISLLTPCHVPVTVWCDCWPTRSSSIGLLRM